jgi:hypothetical protein
MRWVVGKVAVRKRTAMSENEHPARRISGLTVYIQTDRLAVAVHKFAYLETNYPARAFE